MTVQDNHAARPLGVERFNTPFYRLLRTLGLFGPSRRINRWLYRVRTQRRALAGQGLVPEQKLTASDGAIQLIAVRKGACGKRFANRVSKALYGVVSFHKCVLCLVDALIIPKCFLGLANPRK